MSFPVFLFCRNAEKNHKYLKISINYECMEKIAIIPELEYNDI